MLSIILAMSLSSMAMSQQINDLVVLKDGSMIDCNIRSNLYTNADVVKVKHEDGSKNEFKVENIDYVVDRGYQFFPKAYTDDKGRELVEWLQLEVDGALRLYSNLDSSALLRDGEEICLKDVKFFLEDDENGFQLLGKSFTTVFSKKKILDNLLTYIGEDAELKGDVESPDFSFRISNIRKIILKYNQKAKKGQRHQI